jgi:TolB-like protein
VRFPLLVAALIGSTCIPISAPAQQRDTRPGIAVLPFENGGSVGPDKEDLEALEIGVQQMLLTELSQNAALRIVERSTLKQILDEQQLAVDGRVDAQTAARVGKLVGARYVVKGAFTDIYGDFRLDGHLVDVETSEILRAREVRARREKIYDTIVDLASRVMAGAKLPPLPETVRESRLNRKIPSEAVTLYSRAQVFQDHGQADKAIELYRLISQKFPAMTEAREALRQLGQS